MVDYGDFPSISFQRALLATRPGALVQWLQLPAWKVGDRGFEPRSVMQVSKKQRFLPQSLVKIQYCGESPWPRGTVLDLRLPGLEFRILCLGAVSVHLSHHLQEVLVAQFSLHVHKGALKLIHYFFCFVCYCNSTVKSWIIVGFPLTVVNDFRRFLGQFSANFRKISQRLFSFTSWLPGKLHWKNVYSLMLVYLKCSKTNKPISFVSEFHYMSNGLT